MKSLRGPLLLVALAGVTLASAARAEVPCASRGDGAVLVSPSAPLAGAPVRVMVATDALGEGPMTLRLEALGPGLGGDVAFEQVVHAGPPGGVVAVATAPAGGLRVRVLAAGQQVTCEEVQVLASAREPRPRGRRAPAWETTRAWDAVAEDLYSLWVGHLFAAPREAELSWPRLAAVIGDPARNLLHGHLGADEDVDGLGLRPDCADFPYVLRAYFSWKLGLPMAYRRCSRGSRRVAPRCEATLTSNAERGGARTDAAAFRAFVGQMRGAVHASTPRPDPTSDASDLYPVALTREALRPGAVYADPYGHVMMVASWHPQTDTTPGALMAVDAQPDETVGRRLFWRGNFLFPPDDGLRGAGWRRFRPVRLKGGRATMASNAGLAAMDGYGDFSLAQWEAGREAFYETMDTLANPRPMTTSVAVTAIIEALAQQVGRRVEAVAAADRWYAEARRKGASGSIPMPRSAPALFLTTGPWEDLSTPSRDLRLLIALDVARALPARIAAAAAGRFRDDLTATGGVAAHLAAALAARTFTYPRSDGTPQTLTLAELVARAEALEVGWNPNDCPEHRWGAPEGSAERQTCDRRAPSDQRRRMERSHRGLFARRERP